MGAFTFSQKHFWWVANAPHYRCCKGWQRTKGFWAGLLVIWVSIFSVFSEGKFKALLSHSTSNRWYFGLLSLARIVNITLSSSVANLKLLLFSWRKQSRESFEVQLFLPLFYFNSGWDLKNYFPLPSLQEPSSKVQGHPWGGANSFAIPTTASGPRPCNHCLCWGVGLWAEILAADLYCDNLWFFLFFFFSYCLTPAMNWVTAILCDTSFSSEASGNLIKFDAIKPFQECTEKMIQWLRS